MSTPTPTPTPPSSTTSTRTLLTHLSSPHSQTRGTAETTYNTLRSTNPSLLSNNLAECMDSTDELNTVGIRQFASVILRRLVSLCTNENTFLPQCPNILQTCVSHFMTEPDLYTKRRHAHTIAQLTLSLPDSGGVDYILNGCAEGVAKCDVSALFLLQQVADYAPSRVWSDENKGGVMSVITQALTHAHAHANINANINAAAGSGNDGSDIDAAELCQLIVTVSSIAVSSSSSSSQSFASASASANAEDAAQIGAVTLQKTLSLLSTLLQKSPTQTLEALESLIEVASKSPSFYTHSQEGLHSIIEACVVISSSAGLSVGVKLGGLQLLTTLSETGRKVILKRENASALTCITEGINRSNQCQCDSALVSCIKILVSETDDDVENWTAEPCSFNDDYTWDGDDDAIAAESYLEALIHNLGGNNCFACVLPVVEMMLNTPVEDWKSKRGALAVLERCMSGSPVAFAKYASIAVNAACACCTSTSTSKVGLKIKVNERVQWQALQLLGSLCNATNGTVNVNRADNNNSVNNNVNVQSSNGDVIVASICEMIVSKVQKIATHACTCLVSFIRGGGGVGTSTNGNRSLISSDSIEKYLEVILTALNAGPLSKTALATSGVEGSAVEMVAGINALACIADASGVKFRMFYGGFMPGVLNCLTSGVDVNTGYLCGYLSSNNSFESCEENDMTVLRGACIEAAAIIGCAVSGLEDDDLEDFDNSLFLPHASSIMTFVMTLLSAANTSFIAVQTNANARVPAPAVPLDKVQSACARICGLMSADFAQFIPSVLPHLLRQAKQNQEIDVTDGTEDGLKRSLTGELDIDVDSGTEAMTMNVPGVGIKKVTMNTTVVQEKSQAARAVYEHARALGGEFGRYAKVCAVTFVPLIGFVYSAEVRATSAEAMGMVYLSCCLFAVKVAEESNDGKQASNDDHYISKLPTDSHKQMPQQLLGTIVNAIVNQLSAEGDRGDPETLVTLAEALSEVCRAAYINLFDNIPGPGPGPGRYVAKLEGKDAKVLVTKLIALISECLQRRALLFEGRDGDGDEDGIDDDEYAEYEDALAKEAELLTPLVDCIGYTLKCGGEPFIPTFDALIAPTFGRLLTTRGTKDIKARFAAICLFDDCIEHLGADMAMKYAPLLLAGVLEGVDDAKNEGDGDVKQASVYGIAQITRQVPSVLQSVALPVINFLVELIQNSGENDEEGEESLIENSISALSSMVLFPPAPFKSLANAEMLTNITELILNRLPLCEDETEAYIVHSNFASMVEQNDICCVGSEAAVTRTVKIMSSVLAKVKDGYNLASGETCGRFGRCVGGLQRTQDGAVMMRIWNGLEAEEQEAVQEAIAQYQ